MNKLEHFIEKAKIVHKNIYDYSKVEYVKSSSKVCIGCKIHGDFWQTPHGHLKGQGCPKCAQIRILENRRRQCETKFFENSRKIHGNKYDYSKVIYINSTTQVCIICSIHGEFWMTPHNHTACKCGCPKCNSRYIDTEIFIQRAAKIHNNTYDYSLSEYHCCEDFVKIICPTHGVFEQKAIQHLCGSGCPKCGMERGHKQATKSLSQFIIDANRVHNCKYDYSKSDYINSKKHLEIICPIHGSFWQTPNDHLDGCGCPKCNPSFKLNTETFVKKASEVHFNHYDYSKVNYINSRTKVCIICPEHGEFWQLPGNHLSGQRCPKCKIRGQSELFSKLCCRFPNELFLWEYKGDWLEKQSIDIYLEKYKIAIEYDGLQHYHPVEYFGGEVEFRRQQDADMRKNKKCCDNGVLLIRVKYGEIDTSLPEICNIILKRIETYGDSTDKN